MTTREKKKNIQSLLFELTDKRKRERTCCLRRRCRWPKAASPHRSSSRIGWGQLLLPVTQDFSPPRVFDPSHTAIHRHMWKQLFIHTVNYFQDGIFTSLTVVHTGWTLHNEMSGTVEGLNSPNLCFQPFVSNPFKCLGFVCIFKSTLTMN